MNNVIYEIVPQWNCYILNSAMMNNVIPETEIYQTMLYLKLC